MPELVGTKAMIALPERYRCAYNITEGYQIRLLSGEWVEVVKTLRIYAPANIVRLDLVDGSATVLRPMEEVMSRRVLADA